MSLFLPESLPIRIKSNDQTLHAQDDFLIKEMYIIKKTEMLNMFLNLKDLHYVYSSHCFITLTKVGEVVN